MVVTPHSEIMLLNVPIDNTYRHTLYFPSVSDQTQYFISRVIHGVTDCTYVRQQTAISYPEHIDNLYNCNYVMYQNANYSGKWFYAFITELEYRNDETTYIHIEQDVLQTWFFDITWKNCYIEREHSVTDNIGDNIVSENLEIGETVVGNRWLSDLGDDLIVVAYVKDDELPGNNVVDIYSPLSFYFAPYTEQGKHDVDNLIAAFTNANKADSIVSVFMCKSKMLNNEYEHTAVVNPNNINGYTPKNKKLFTFPYCYLSVRTILGDSQIYRYEYFNTSASNEYKFKIMNCITINPVSQLFPIGYKTNPGESVGSGPNYEYGLSYSQFPQCGWTNDVFAQWYAANRNSVNVGAVSQGLGLISNILIGNAPGALNSTSAIAENVANVMDIANKPPKINGQIVNDAFAFNHNLTGYIFESMTIKAEYAKRIDDYFTMFGYRTLENKIPSFNNRPVFSYVKMLECNLAAAIPNDAIQKIKSICINGCTWWRYPQYIGDYSVDNSIGSTPDPGPEPEPQPESFVSPINQWWNYVTSEYGNRVNPITGQPEFHKGIDIARPEGTPIYAVLPGIVHTVNHHVTGYGNHIILKHENGMYTMYAHCSTIGVTVGANIEKGAVIAGVGSTGQSTGNHLHFTVYLDYNAKITDNPRKYLPTS